MWLVELNYNFECDWLNELSDNKLPNNKLSNNKLSGNNSASESVENRTFLKPITIEEIEIFLISGKIFYIKIPTTIAFLSRNDLMLIDDIVMSG